MSLGEVGAELLAVLDTIHQQRTTNAAIASAIAATRDRVRQLTRGSQHPLVFKLLSQWDGALAKLYEADQAMAGAASALVEYLQIIGVGASGSESVPAAVSSPPPASAPVPTYIAEAAARLPHRKKTVGAAFDAVGRPLTSGDIVSGQELDPGIPPTDTRLRRDGKWHLLESTQTHVEGKVAAKMRQEGVRQASVVVTRPPCPGPDGCRVRLGQILPRGSVLSVYVAGEDGTVRHFGTFTGTGEAVPS